MAAGEGMAGMSQCLRFVSPKRHIFAVFVICRASTQARVLCVRWALCARTGIPMPPPRGFCASPHSRAMVLWGSILS